MSSHPSPQRTRRKWRRALKVIGWIALGFALLLYLWPDPYVREAKQAAALAASAAWKTQFVDVEPHVALEVLDFGGTGRPVLLLAGLGGNAHSFRAFAPKLTPMYHVFAVTRRGFGNSTWPARGYATQRLGDDVAAVIDALKLDKPVVIGHSFAGAELSSLAARHPDKVSGLVYLEAGYDYALEDTSAEHPKLSLARLALKAASWLPRVCQPPALRVMTGKERFVAIKPPVLAIFALPHALGEFIRDPERLKKAEAEDLKITGAQADAFARQVPQAKVIRLPNASHVIYRSNEAEVLTAVQVFVAQLP